VKSASDVGANTTARGFGDDVANQMRLVSKTEASGGATIFAAKIIAQELS
jgi:hypothetical protein